MEGREREASGSNSENEAILLKLFMLTIPQMVGVAQFSSKKEKILLMRSG